MARPTHDPKKHHPVWRRPDILRLWGAQTSSLLGMQVTELVLPTIAILNLHASPPAIGALVALPWLAFLVIGLPAGVLVDRVSHRRLMVTAALGRVAFLVAIPVLSMVGCLTLVLLYCAAVGIGILTVLTQVAARSHLPQLVARRELLAGNTALTLGEGVAQVGGPVVGGTLIQLLGAPLTLLVDAGAALVTVPLVQSMRTPESLHSRQERWTAAWQDLRTGVGVVARHPVLRPLTVASTVANLGTATANGVILLFAYRSLHLTPGTVGVATALGSIGFILAASITGRLTDVLGSGRTLFVTSVLYGAAYVVVPVGLLGFPAVVYAVWRFLFSAADPPYSVTVASVRQAVSAPTLQGRVTGTSNAVGRARWVSAHSSEASLAITSGWRPRS